eukprot:CAMPEP_0206035462 /NCGR_PEP_ID=MMETSP1466-20131121/2097_1 /ASSEMBLY_ACC=CAM_ASM_001126 /TAXON_ID=44452 /ORGANISM="Pavlova gyrans, Strain CCMP608" /LENGTH=65 /DNA_ID=CAMNT_0053409847 /DNA_START=297 /DNA_END=491 /DNA_ORIENTATION=+
MGDVSSLQFARTCAYAKSKNVFVRHEQLGGPGEKIMVSLTRSGDIITKARHATPPSMRSGRSSPW